MALNENARIREAQSDADRALRDLRDLTARYERLSAFTQALWRLLKDRFELADDELLAEMEAVKREAVPELREAARHCGRCQKPVSRAARVCIYCEAPLGTPDPLALLER